MTQHVFLVTDSKGRILEGVEGYCHDCVLYKESCIHDKSGRLLCSSRNNLLKKSLTFRDTGKRMPWK